MSENSERSLEERVADLEARVVSLRIGVWSLFGLILGIVFFGDVVVALLMMVLFPVAIVAAVAGLIYVVFWAMSCLSGSDTPTPDDAVTSPSGRPTE